MSAGMIKELTYADGSAYAAARPVELIRRLDRRRFELPRLFGRADFPVADTAVPTANQYPDLHVDELRDVVVLPRHVILDGSRTQVLSQSFKKRPRQRHFGLTHHGDLRFSPTRPYRVADERRIREPVFYLDCEFADIYGHHLLEVWLQTWALDLLDAGELRFATSIRLRPYVLQVLEQLGVPAHKIIPVTGPVRCDRLFVAAPAVLARRYVHPVCDRVLDRIARLASPGLSADRPGPRIYLSRRAIGERPMINEAAIEQLATEAGYEVFHAQDHPIAEQLAVFGRATHLVGPGGSGMHNAIFAPRSVSVMIMASTGWFTVIDTRLAQGRYRLGYVFGDPVEESERDRRTKAPWAVDPETVAAALADPWYS